MTFTSEQVEEAFALAFPSDDLLYDEIGWEKYEEEPRDKDAHLREYLEDEYAAITDLLDWSETAYDLKDKTVNIIINGQEVPVTCVEKLGGMDEGTNANVTFRVGEQYFTKVGWYQSHYGYEYDGDFIEVEPRTKTVTYYERKS